ncbi:unnamed protein product [Coregonus sp. 'balchen']|nr:unnamed protein product [Coregonus sp. 'balchen']
MAQPQAVNIYSRMYLAQCGDVVVETVICIKGNNSIRHNLSLNKCFLKVPRSKDDPGKASTPYSLESESLRMDCIMYGDASPTLAINTVTNKVVLYKTEQEGSDSPRSSLNNSLSDQSLASVNLNSVGSVHSYTPYNVAEGDKQLLFSDFEDLSASFRSLYNTPMAEAAAAPTATNTHTTTVTIKTTHPTTNHPTRSTSLPTPRTTNTNLINTLNTGSTHLNTHSTLNTASTSTVGSSSLSADWYPNLDWLKERCRIAGSYNWADVDLSPFQGLKESMRQAELNNWSLDPAQIADLCSSINQFFTRTRVIPPQGPLQPQPPPPACHGPMHTSKPSQHINTELPQGEEERGIAIGKGDGKSGRGVEPATCPLEKERHSRRVSIP